jgi:hypothetical protein
MSVAIESMPAVDAPALVEEPVVYELGMIMVNNKIRGIKMSDDIQVWSVHDGITIFCEKNDDGAYARKTWSRLIADGSEYKEELVGDEEKGVKGLIYWIDLPSQLGNRTYRTPMMTVIGLQRLLMILGGRVVAEFRKTASTILTRYLAGDISDKEIAANKASSAPINVMMREAWAQESGAQELVEVDPMADWMLDIMPEIALMRPPQDRNMIVEEILKDPIFKQRLNAYADKKFKLKEDEIEHASTESYKRRAIEILEHEETKATKSLNLRKSAMTSEAIANLSAKDNKSFYIDERKANIQERLAGAQVEYAGATERIARATEEKQKKDIEHKRKMQKMDTDSTKEKQEMEIEHKKKLQKMDIDHTEMMKKKHEELNRVIKEGEMIRNSMRVSFY